MAHVKIRASGPRLSDFDCHTYRQSFKRRFVCLVVADVNCERLLRQVSEALASPHTSTSTDAAPGAVPQADPGTA